VPPVREIARSDAGPAHALRGVRVIDPHQAVGVGKGQGTEQHGVDQGEEGGARADAEGDGEHAHRGEAPSPSQRAEGEGRVLEEHLEMESEAAFAELLPRDLGIAQFQARLSASVRRIEAGFDLPRHRELDVVREFVVSLAVEAAGAERLGETAEHGLQHGASLP
jgi:hypothetical protein